MDVYIPSLHIGIEYDGVQWHSSSPARDRDKYQSCKEKGITLIRIREDNKRVEEIADKTIIRKRPFTLNSLSESIQELMRLLGIDDEIDVQKEEIRIKESYYRNIGENSLQAKYPLIAKQWHPTKNGRLTPSMISAGSEDEYWWRCEFDHDWKAAVKNRAKGEGCRICKYIKLSEERLKTTDEFKKEMEIINPNVLVVGEYTGALEPIRCICKTCNYGRDPKRLWMPRPNDLLNGHGCPKCANRLKKTHSEFVFEMKNLHPKIEVVGQYITNKTPIECRCLECGYGANGEWTPTPNELLTSGGCPKCSFARRGFQRRKTHEQFVQEMSNLHPTIRVVGHYKTNKDRIQCICLKCGYGSNGEWTPRPDKLLQGNGCKICNKNQKKKDKKK